MLRFLNLQMQYTANYKYIHLRQLDFILGVSLFDLSIIYAVVEFITIADL